MYETFQVRQVGRCQLLAKLQGFEPLLAGSDTFVFFKRFIAVFDELVDLEDCRLSVVRHCSPNDRRRCSACSKCARASRADCPVCGPTWASTEVRSACTSKSLTSALSPPVSICIIRVFRMLFSLRMRITGSLSAISADSTGFSAASRC